VNTLEFFVWTPIFDLAKKYKVRIPSGKTNMSPKKIRDRTKAIMKKGVLARKKYEEVCKAENEPWKAAHPMQDNTSKEEEDILF